MKTYYRLEEDLHIRGRWQLRGPVDDPQRNENEFWQSERLMLRGPLFSSIHTVGKPLDFSMTVNVVPILSKRFADAVRLLIHEHAQLWPVHIDGHDGFEVMNTTRLVACLDESRSEFTKWTDEDGRPDKIGHYQMVTRLRLDPNQIPPDLHVFRVWGWKIALIVSQAFVDAILPLNPIGPKLELVT